MVRSVALAIGARGVNKVGHEFIDAAMQGEHS